MAKKAQTLQTLKQANRNTQEQARARISLSKLVDKLQACALGETDLTASQIKAASILLDKALPTISKEERDITVNHSHSITDQTLQLLKASVKRIEGVTIEHEPIKIENRETIDSRNDGNEGSMESMENGENDGLGTHTLDQSDISLHELSNS